MPPCLYFVLLLLASAQAMPSYESSGSLVAAFEACVRPLNESAWVSLLMRPDPTDTIRLMLHFKTLLAINEKIHLSRSHPCKTYGQAYKNAFAAHEDVGVTSCTLTPRVAAPTPAFRTCLNRLSNFHALSTLKQMR